MVRSQLMLASALLFTASGAAAQVRTYDFVSDGQHIHYTAEKYGEFIRFKGVVLESREPFTLTMGRTGQVVGQFGYAPVSFTVDRSVREKVLDELADTPATTLTAAAQ